MSEAKKLMQYEANKKSSGVTYALWFFFGILGVHRFYLGRGGSGAAILVLTILSAVLMPIGVGAVTIFIPGIWVFIDLFLISGMVRDHNNSLINMLSM